tara:strand:+ start:448 stop:1125 length:678 start_codon:yes stop_codon:yes gene_type:complete
MILIGGCSNFDKNYYTKEGLDVVVWTDKIKTKNINVSGAGYSNLQIKDAVMNTIIQNKHNIEHVYVFWSEWSRIGNPYVAQYHDYLNNSLSIKKWILSNEKFGEEDIHHNQLIDTNLNIFIAMESFLNQHKIPYTFYQTLEPFHFRDTEHEYEFTRQLIKKPQFNHITWDNFWGWPMSESLNGNTLYSYMKNQLDEIAVSKTNPHMNQKAHDFLANNMVDNRLKL